MKKVIIIRDLFFDQQASLGTCYILGTDFKAESLERGWVDNQNRISCVPVGTYPLKLEYSPKFKKKLWELYNVPNRTECKFHVANYWWQLNGCIALGNNRKYIDGDAVMDITSSADTMREFEAAMGPDTVAELHIFNLVDLATLKKNWKEQSRKWPLSAT